MKRTFFGGKVYNATSSPVRMLGDDGVTAQVYWVPPRTWSTKFNPDIDYVELYPGKLEILHGGIYYYYPKGLAAPWWAWPFNLFCYLGYKLWRWYGK